MTSVPDAGDPGSPPGIAVALSGGGARTIAHIGVLRVLASEGIPVGRIAGTSGGGLIAVLFAAGYPLLDLERDALSIEWRRLAELRPHPLGLLATEKLGEFVARRIGELRFEALRIPCAVVAADLTAGGRRVFDRGPVVPAVRATCAVPEFYRPVELDGHILVDGGVVEPLPVETVLGLDPQARLPCLAVNVLPRVVDQGAPRHPLQLLGRITGIVQQELARRAAAAADWSVEPELSGFTFFGLDNAEGLLAAGAAAVRAQLPRLRERLRAAPA
ncbi:MAG: patatin-like phospholipase family protein [Candidatus Eisenbacteria bacterium]|uniref:Patatin-like phospholipase family protein n=1 Tax=Eiseniibacteriota bacterium TaxID=2212470 RepID=A0A937X9C1_UNCEI|nr:patatin-like phospholipase family protein [Candidatus Eisenbacteria bacterium]